MPKRSFSIYHTTDDLKIEDSDRFVLELGKTHLACVLTKADKKSIKAFELFDFTLSETNFPDELFSGMTTHSRLLGHLSGNIHVYINHEYCIPVPIFKFNTEIANDYLQMVFGNDNRARIHFEHLPIEPGIMNVFRVFKPQTQFLQNLPKVTYHHTYSNVIRRHTSGAIPQELMTVQFYNTYFIVLVIQDSKLQLIQSFVYENAEDVLYCLLNICDRFAMQTGNINLQISGMIDLEFKLYRELIKYFMQVTVDHIDAGFLPSTHEHPLHYFTPFFNLAL